MSSPPPNPPVAASAPLGTAFWQLWSASTAANLGDGVRRVAFPLLALTLTRDPVLISVVAAATTLPWLLIGPVAGVVIDRYDRLRLLWTVNAGRTAVVAALVVALATGQASIAVLIVAALLLGAGETFVNNAALALVPRTVAPVQLERANARLYGAQVITGQFLGQGITGALFAAAALAPFALNAAALATATATAAILSARSARSTGATGAGPQPQRARRPALQGAVAAFAEVAEGVRWLFTNALLRALWIVLAALGFASGAFWGVIALYAADILSLGPTGFGLFLAIGAAGSLLGSQIAPAVRDRLGTAGAMYAGVALVVAASVGLAITRSPVVATALMVANGVGVLVWNVVGVSLRQRVVPDHLLGRVNAAFSMVAVGGATAGALIAGLVAGAAGLPAVFWLSAAIIAIPALLVAPSLRGKEKT